VSQLRKYIPSPSRVLDNLSFEAKPVRIEDHYNKQFRGKTINMVKVVCDDRFGDLTWEFEKKSMRKTYPISFLVSQFSGTKIFLFGRM